MGRLTKRNHDGSVGISELRHYNYDDFQKLAQKLAHYEDLEERIEKLFDGKISLNEAVEEIEKKVHGEEVFRYSRILTNAEAEKWDKWLDLEEQGRLIEVVKCKDCSCFEEITDAYNYYFCNRYGGIVTENDYCSRAEAKLKELKEGVE